MGHLEDLGYGDGPTMLTLILANVASNICWKNALEFLLDYVIDTLEVQHGIMNSAIILINTSP